jgi:Tfp pilus assembly protein PilO
MITEKFKQELQAKPGQFALIAIVMLLIFALIIYRFKDYFSIAWPTKSKIKTAMVELQRAQNKLQDALNEEHKIKTQQNEFISLSKNYWILERNGEPSLNIQKIINKAAESAGIDLTSLGSAKMTDLSESLAVVGIQIRAKASLHDITTFINEIDKLQPKAYWQNLYLRPDNPKNPVEIVMSGTIQFLVIKNKDALKILLSGND